MSAPENRKAEISKAIGDAMKALGRDYDFGKVSPEITKSGHELDEAICDYRDGIVTKRVVQDRYKVWRDLHKTGRMSV